ncbi:hypothetical protein L3X07_02905 [Levilactobacillus brevis]|nr:hypothetical protein [Levilactobacillus brevis]
MALTHAAKVQGAKAVTAIATNFIWVPVVLALVIGGILYLWYQLDESKIASAKAAKEAEKKLSEEDA